MATVFLDLLSYDINAKKIVLHLARNPEREFSRNDLKRELNLDMSDLDLEERMLRSPGDLDRMIMSGSMDLITRKGSEVRD